MLERSSLALTAVLGVLGFSLVAAAVTGRAQRLEQAPRKAELIALIEDRRGLVGDLDEALDQLRRDLAAEQERAARRDAAARETAELTSELATLAGTVAVRGPGLVVTLAPSERPPPSPEEAGAYRIHDSDLQRVVNALFQSGAEAVAVNDSRLVATTPIRSAGDTIIVNFRPLSPPYRIEAVGARKARFDATSIADQFRRWAKLFGLGFRVGVDDDVVVPAYTGRVAISTARPLGTG